MPGKVISILQKLWDRHRVLATFLVLMILFRGAVADWSPVPTGSMKPTIIEGDVILVNKLVYGLRLPLVGTSLYAYSGPLAGDIVVFDSRRAGKRLVKRIVGVPGDKVEVRNNRVIINGKAASYDKIGPASDGLAYEESFAGSRHRVTLGSEHYSHFDYGPVIVPVDHFFVMGDNRAHSADSRVYGFVPRDEVVGRVQRVLASFDMQDHYLPRGQRVLTPLDP